MLCSRAARVDQRRRECKFVGESVVRAPELQLLVPAPEAFFDRNIFPSHRTSFALARTIDKALMLGSSPDITKNCFF
jgi:hypothetical protein